MKQQYEVKVSRIHAVTGRWYVSSHRIEAADMTEAAKQALSLPHEADKSAWVTLEKVKHD